MPTKARVTNYQDKSLKLELQYKVEDQWELCFETGPVTIPPIAYLGFSAETGEVSDNFDIIKVESRNLYEVSPDMFKPTTSNKKLTNKSPKSPSGRSSSESSGGWAWFFIRTVLFLVVCAGGYVGFTMYRTSTQKSSRLE